MKKLFVLLAALSTVSFVAPQEASAWSNRGYFQLYVLGHRFNQVVVRTGRYRFGTQCQLRVKVKFWAPSHQYHRFQAKITMSNGAWVRTPVFYNQGYGSRTYTYTHDTRYQGCWAVRYHYVKHLRVHGCTGYGCRVRPVY